MKPTSLRLGAVSYLNTKPLVWGLSELLPEARLSFDLPSRLAQQLASGELDIALIPSIEFFQDPSYSIVSDACIACRGPVWSVKLFSRVPVREIRTIALDEGSRTSVGLLRVLLAERFQIFPTGVPLPMAAQPEHVPADAMLLIGDRAIHAPPGNWAFVWDLGGEWNQWTQLPFVFAMWTARPGIPADLLLEAEHALRGARDAGMNHLQEIAEREAEHVRLSAADCWGYLHDNLHFQLGPNEQAGLSLFHQFAVKLKLAPNGAAYSPIESVAS